MAKLVKKCPHCGKPATLRGEKLIYGRMFLRTYECGHSETIIGVSVSSDDTDTLNIISLDGKRPFKYQLEGGRFLEAANGVALIADEVGVGKTIQTIMFLVAHPECRPFFIFCKAGLRVQWSKELVRWGDFVCQVIEEGSAAHFLPGMDGYVISMDSAWRIGHKIVKGNKALGTKQEYVPIPGKTLPDIVEKLKIKTAVLDECQLIKNSTSKRTQGIRDAARNVKHRIALSGTPIKNNAAEYFPVLNLLRPDKFPKQNEFVYGWCDSYFDGYSTKTGGLKDPKKFQEFTKDFIIRRERKDVLPDLPRIFRQFSFCELGEMVEDMYKQTMQEYMEFYAESGSMSGFERGQNILAYLSKMRHLAGLAKIEPVCNWMEEFILSTDRKMCIFVHHKDVGDTLALKLMQMAKEYPAEWGHEILRITSEMDSYARDVAITKFSDAKHRIMIASTLAAGEGLNMQFCSDMIMAERQWNPANEEQCEGRFPRPGSTADKINAGYWIATGTVDEFFSELVEKKREIVTATMSGEAVKWDQSSLVQELGKIIFERGGARWGF